MRIYGVMCILLTIFPHQSRKSFENLPNWLADARALASPDLAVVLVGSKLDKYVNYMVSQEIGMKN